MNIAASIDKQISEYLLELNQVQKKAVLSVVKAFASEQDAFDKEMERRFTEMENGTVKGYTLEESEKRARAAYKASKK